MARMTSRPCETWISPSLQEAMHTDAASDQAWKVKCGDWSEEEMSAQDRMIEGGFLNGKLN